MKAWMMSPTGYDNLTTFAMCVYFTRADAQAALTRGKRSDTFRIVRVEIRKVPAKAKR